LRKHNKRFTQRWGREKGDRSNFPQVMAHGFVKNKPGQLLANSLLLSLLHGIGIRVPGAWLRKKV